MRIARVYDDPTPQDGTRVLVDRLWPRGLRKDDSRVGTWVRDVAPSNGLRQWYGHDPGTFAEFAERYRAELDQQDAADALENLRSLHAGGRLTLVTATRTLELSHAVVLAELIDPDDGEETP
ncbi:DUF488 domain-containing protein [Ruania alba]|uniref:Uncharacterized conserved protein YeaO, DUF488 family n=1 Tax=Ruania alba TaxID=648782 RepID=A0A1H5EVW8_9MICO|nr:DUF488 family protein [Ruania alba]SED95138.1 Uncharacterized conserved protein YeaO, DUF488 family [Ruania alba]